MGGLFILRAGLALRLGIKNSWFFSILILVYVGGIIIIFTYITSVIASRKILGVTPRTVSGLAVALIIFATAHTSNPASTQVLWPGIILGANVIPFIFFIVVYLLLALISVFILIEKEAGPLKIK